MKTNDRKKWILLLLLIFMTLKMCFGSSILFYSGISSPGHKVVLWSLATELNERGHNITFLSPFATEEKHENITEIIPKYYAQLTLGDLKENNIFMTKYHGNSSNIALMVVPFAVEACKSILTSPESKVLFNPNTKFDLLVIDAMFNDCALGLVHIYKSPFIYFSTNGFYSWLAYTTAQPNPSPWSMDNCIPFFDGHEMYNRIANFVLPLYWMYVRNFEVFPEVKRLFEEYVNVTLPDLNELDSNVSITLINSNPVLDIPQPFLPDVISVGGIHYKKHKPLSKDIEDFMNESPDGFILFSFGYIVHSSHVPNTTIRNLLKVFSKLPQRILWKWDDEEAIQTKLPQNVMVKKWLPHADILAHPKARAFITHGGILNVYEALLNAIPLIVIPFYSDQEKNGYLAQERQYGIKLEAYELEDFHLLTNSITEVITNPKYRENAEEISHILKDEKESPLERAVYWTEYVLRHNGAQHLRSHARHLPIYIFYHVDALAFASLVIISVIILTKFLWACTRQHNTHLKIKGNK